jgi:superfamily II DNA helicase RecQ
MAKVKKLAERLACNAYFHDAVGKASMLADFMEGKQRVVVATSALGIGVDIADIRCIIRIHWPRTILDYAQESGRAGEMGCGSEAVIIGQEGDQGACNDKQGEEEHGLVRLYAEGDGRTTRWRGRVLDEYLDRRGGREGCEEGEERCDMCRGAEEEMEVVGSEDNSEEEDESEDEEEQMGEETDREEARGVLEQQEQERRGRRQRLIQQRQQEVGEVEWLRRQLAW